MTQLIRYLFVLGLATAPLVLGPSLAEAGKKPAKAKCTKAGKPCKKGKGCKSSNCKKAPPPPAEEPEEEPEADMDEE